MNTLAWALVLVCGAVLVVFSRQAGNVWNRFVERSWRKLGAQMTQFEMKLSIWLARLIGLIFLVAGAVGLMVEHAG